ATDTDRHRGLIESHAAPDRHEVLLAGLVGDLRRIEERGVPVVHHDRASVDAARCVAPFGEGPGRLEELDVEAGLYRVARIGEGGDVDALRRDAPSGGAAAAPGTADLAHPGPRAGRRHGAGG